MLLLSREQILAANDLQFEDVPVPEWGDGACVRVRGLNAKERIEISKSIMGEDGQVDSALSLDLTIIVPFMCMVDDQGRRLFTDQADVERLGAKSTAALQRVMDVAKRLNGLTEGTANAQKKA
jgi:hypothetical protein